MIYLDTNAVVWLAGAHGELSATAVQYINEAEILYISPMVELEIEYLYEIGRLQLPANKIIEHLLASINLQYCQRSFTAVVAKAATFKWTRDPFDRLITAQAALGQDTLLTRDKIIRANYPNACW